MSGSTRLTSVKEGVAMEIRKIVTLVEDTMIEGGRSIELPVRKVAVAAVLKNPYSGQYEEDLSSMVEEGGRLGSLLAERALAALSRPVENFGKGGIVGTDGELEHVAALFHLLFGEPVRKAVGGGKAIIPSA
jgi:hypothetical protein